MGLYTLLKVRLLGFLGRVVNSLLKKPFTGKYYHSEAHAVFAWGEEPLLLAGC
jgi:hypothetical protein